MNRGKNPAIEADTSLDSDSPALIPFLKWPGGKRWAAKQVADIAREHLTGRYYEPFLGGGAVFFQLRPKKATLSDINGDLIDVYRAVRTRHRQIVRLLQGLPVSREAYSEIRRWDAEALVERAVRFLYLNRTAFGGMYRLNKEGLFNVPYGGGERTPAILWESRILEDAARSLQGADLRVCDFAASMGRARAGDVVYCDPTYTVAHKNNGFVRYNERNFSWADQKRLAEAATAARARGAVVIISNAHHESIYALFKPRTKLITLERMSCISTDPAHRRVVNEYLIVLEP
jgi:DNA adenine methylase